MNLGGIAGAGQAVPSFVQQVSLLGGAALNSLVTATSLTATSFSVLSVTAALIEAHTGSIPTGIGQQLFLTVNNFGVGTLWQANFRNSDGTLFFPLDLTIPNAVPGTTQIQVQIGTISGLGLSATAAAIVTLIASIT
jgi:hypothetical protein